MNTITINPTTLIADISKLIDGARQRIAQTFNAELSLLYWQIGQRLQSEILNGERGEYGKQIIKRLSEKLTVFMVVGGVKNSCVIACAFLKYSQTFKKSPHCGDN